MNKPYLKETLLILPNIENFSEINYRYIDKIGRFSFRRLIPISIKGDKVILDLSVFKKNIMESIKIELDIETEAFKSIENTKINNLYYMKLYKGENKLYIEFLPKRQKWDYEFGKNNFKINNINFSNMKLCKVLGNANLFNINATELYAENHFYNINDIISYVKKDSISNQNYALKGVTTDDFGNVKEEFIDFKDIFNEFKNVFESNNIFYNTRYNYLKTGYLKNVVINYLKVDEDSNKICLTFPNHEIVANNDTNLILKMRNKQGNTFEYTNQLMAKKELGKFVFEKQELLNLRVQNQDSLDLILYTSVGEFYIVISKDNLISRYISLDSLTHTKFYVNGRKCLSIYIKKERNLSNTTKVAVLGTCFSRNAFNSDKYFNPGYKDFVQCVYTQFHSTIQSLLSQKPPSKILDVFERNGDYKYIKTDIMKTFFSELKASEAEYLIIDFYPDAMLKELTLKNNVKITYNYLIKDYTKLSEFVEDWGYDKFDNIELYLIEWRKKLKVFLRRLFQIIPQDKIILNKGRLAENYYSENGNKVEFKTIDLIKRNNYIWERMDSIVLEEFPDIKTIDMTLFEYNADPNYPFGFSYSHYESTYYKVFFNKFLKLLV